MQSDNSLALRLGRVLIAIAWSDGRLDEEERKGLSDILFRLPELRPDEWDLLRQEMASPPSAGAAESHLSALRTDFAERDDILPFLEELARKDSPFSTADRALAQRLRTELESSQGLQLSGWVGGLRDRLRDGAARVRKEIENLQRGEDELRGGLPDGLDASSILERIGEEGFRRLSLLGALLGRVAHADHRLDESEIRQMRESLQRMGGLSEDEAAVVCEIGCQRALESLDSYALSREFFQLSSEQQRIAALDLLFTLAHSDGEASPQEIEEIRSIRQGFLLSHRHFADARVRARQRAESRGDQSAQ